MSLFQVDFLWNVRIELALMIGGVSSTTEVMDQYPTKVEGLEISETADGFMIHQPEKDRVHYLNHTAVVILEMCTGENSEQEIAETLQKAYGLSSPPTNEVRETLSNMIDEGLVISKTAPA